MNGVIGMAELLLDTSLDPLQSEYALTIRQSASALLTIINDILDFSKIEAGKLQLEHLDMSLQDVLEDVARLLANQAHAKGLELIAIPDPDLPNLVSGDAGRLRQVLLNLVGNAVKFTQSGEVAIECALLETTQNSVWVRCEVRDTGIGIPSDRMGTLFQAFTQVDATTTRRFGGTGLGLSIVKRLVELMGGEVGVESQEGAGSKFWFTARFEPATAAQSHASKTLPNFDGQRVLVVDHNVTARRMLVRTLARHRLEPACATSADEAVSLLRNAVAVSRPFDVVIMDQLMPGCEDLHGILEYEPALRGTPALLLTSTTQPKSGFAGHVIKPIKQGELMQCLAMVLGIAPTASSTSALLTTSQVLRAQPLPTDWRILLAEDNTVNQKVACRLLEKLGYRVDVVDDGQAAFDAWRKGHYDLILMDCQMPRLDGFQTTRQIRAAETTDQHVSIVALTAHAMKGTDNECIAAGMDDYLSKPIDREQLRACLERQLLARSRKQTPMEPAVELSKVAQNDG
jgi:CheY-like chemotaxis protein